MYSHVLPVCRVHRCCIAVAPEDNDWWQDVQRGIKLQQKQKPGNQREKGGQRGKHLIISLLEEDETKIGTCSDMYQLRCLSSFKAAVKTSYGVKYTGSNNQETGVDVW